MKTPIILIVLGIVMSLFVPEQADARNKRSYRYSDGKRVTYVEKNYYRSPRVVRYRSYPTYAPAYYRPYYYSTPYYRPYYYNPGGVNVSVGF